MRLDGLWPYLVNVALNKRFYHLVHFHHRFTRSSRKTQKFYLSLNFHNGKLPFQNHITAHRQACARRLDNSLQSDRLHATTIGMLRSLWCVIWFLFAPKTNSFGLIEPKENFHIFDWNILDNRKHKKQIKLNWHFETFFSPSKRQWKCDVNAYRWWL